MSMLYPTLKSSSSFSSLFLCLKLFNKSLIIYINGITINYYK